MTNRNDPIHTSTINVLVTELNHVSDRTHFDAFECLAWLAANMAKHSEATILKPNKIVHDHACEGKFLGHPATRKFNDTIAMRTNAKKLITRAPAEQQTRPHVHSTLFRMQVPIQ